MTLIPEYDVNADWLIIYGNINSLTPAAVPEPATFWLFSSALLGLFGMRYRKEAA